MGQFNRCQWHCVLTESFEQIENANAIRWGTTYNFRFTSPYPPTNGQIKLDFFKATSEPNRFALADVPDVPEIASLISTEAAVSISMTF